MKRTPRVMIPPRIEIPKKHCVQEGTACPSAQSTHSEKAVFSAETTPRGVVPTQPQRSEGSDTAPMQERQKSTVCREKNSLKAHSRNISFLCRRWKIPLRKPLFPIGAEVSFYGSFYHLRWRWPASHLSGLRQSRCPAKCTGRAKPCTQIPGGSPDPLLATIGEKHEKRYQIQHAHGIR